VNAIDFGVSSNFEPKVPDQLKKAEFIFLATLHPKLQQDVLSQMDNCKFSFMDTITHYIQNDKKELEKTMKKVDGIVLNDIEARMICKTPNLVKAGKTLLKDYGLKMALIKKGENGCILFQNDSITPFPAFPLENIVDPTGAGDTFAGGFFGQLAKEEKITNSTIRNSIAMANVMGSFAVEDFSLNKLFAIGQKDIEQRLKEYKRAMCLGCEHACRV